MIIALIWLVSMLIASPDVIFLHTRLLYEENGYTYTDCTYSWPEENTKIYQLCIVTLLFALPFVLMTISYSQIVNVLWRNESMEHSFLQSAEAAEAEQLQIEESRRKYESKFEAKRKAAAASELGPSAAGASPSTGELSNGSLNSKQAEMQSGSNLIEQDHSSGADLLQAPQHSGASSRLLGGLGERRGVEFGLGLQEIAHSAAHESVGLVIGTRANGRANERANLRAEFMDEERGLGIELEGALEGEKLPEQQLNGGATSGRGTAQSLAGAPHDEPEPVDREEQVGCDYEMIQVQAEGEPNLSSCSVLASERIGAIIQQKSLARSLDGSSGMAKQATASKSPALGEKLAAKLALKLRGRTSLAEHEEGQCKESKETLGANKRHHGDELMSLIGGQINHNGQGGTVCGGNERQPSVCERASNNNCSGSSGRLGGVCSAPGGRLAATRCEEGPENIGTMCLGKCEDSGWQQRSKMGPNWATKPASDPKVQTLNPAANGAASRVLHGMGASLCDRNMKYENTRTADLCQGSSVELGAEIKRNRLKRETAGSDNGGPVGGLEEEKGDCREANLHLSAGGACCCCCCRCLRCAPAESLQQRGRRRQAERKQPRTASRRLERPRAGPAEQEEPRKRLNIINLKASRRPKVQASSADKPDSSCGRHLGDRLGPVRQAGRPHRAQRSPACCSSGAAGDALAPADDLGRTTGANWPPADQARSAEPGRHAGAGSGHVERPHRRPLSLGGGGGWRDESCAGSLASSTRADSLASSTRADSSWPPARVGVTDWGRQHDKTNYSQGICILGPQQLETSSRPAESSNSLQARPSGLPVLQIDDCTGMPAETGGETVCGRAEGKESSSLARPKLGSDTSSSGRLASTMTSVSRSSKGGQSKDRQAPVDGDGCGDKCKPVCGRRGGHHLAQLCSRAAGNWCLEAASLAGPNGSWEGELLGAEQTPGGAPNSNRGGPSPSESAASVQCCCPRAALCCHLGAPERRANWRQAEGTHFRRETSAKPLEAPPDWLKARPGRTGSPPCAGAGVSAAETTDGPDSLPRGDPSERGQWANGGGPNKHCGLAKTGPPHPRVLISGPKTRSGGPSTAQVCQWAGRRFSAGSAGSPAARSGRTGTCESMADLIENETEDSSSGQIIGPHAATGDERNHPVASSNQLDLFALGSENGLCQSKQGQSLGHNNAQAHVRAAEQTRGSESVQVCGNLLLATKSPQSKLSVGQTGARELAKGVEEEEARIRHSLNNDGKGFIGYCRSLKWAKIGARRRPAVCARLHTAVSLTFQTKLFNYSLDINSDNNNNNNNGNTEKRAEQQHQAPLGANTSSLVTDSAGSINHASAPDTESRSLATMRPNKLQAGVQLGIAASMKQRSQQQQQQMAISDNSSHSNHVSSPSALNARFYKLIESRKKAAKMLIIVVITFGLCFLPIHLLNTLR